MLLLVHPLSANHQRHYQENHLYPTTSYTQTLCSLPLTFAGLNSFASDFGHWQREGELGPSTDLAFHLDPPPMGLYQIPDNGQPQARATS